VALALNLLFEPETAAAVRRLWQDLADAGVSADMLGLGYPPHLTLLVSDDERHVASLVPALAELAPRAPSSLRLGSVSTFAETEVVYLGCGGDLTRLRELHRAAAVLLPEESIRPYYRPANWTPHVTLQTIGDAARALSLVRRRWPTGRDAMPTRLELATFLPVVVGEGIDLPS
jgi:2'-5' RNA ligase